MCFILVALTLWALLILPPAVDTLRMEIIRWDWMQTHNSYTSTDFELPDLLENLVWNPVSTKLLLNILKYCFIFPVIGVALWLTGFPEKKQT